MKRFIKVLLASILGVWLGSTGLFGVGFIGDIVYAGSIRDVNFYESTNNDRYETVTLPGLNRILNVTVDNNGVVNYEVNGENVKLHVFGGSVSRKDPPGESASKIIYNNVDKFESIIFHKDDTSGYSGDLYKIGNSYLAGGQLIPAVSKNAEMTVTNTTDSFDDTYSYSDTDGFKGTLNKSGPVTDISHPEVVHKKDIIDKEYYNTHTWYYDANKKLLFEEWSWDNSNDHSTIQYDDGEYKGTLKQTRYSPSPISDFEPASHFSNSSVRYKRWDKTTGYYTGTVTKVILPAYTGYIQKYTGTVTKDAKDTRIWAQNYSGTIYAANTTSYYKYNVKIEYNAAPAITIISPLPQQVFSENNTAFVPTVSVSDRDGDTLTCRYYVDGESAPRDTRTISNTISAQTVSFNALNIGALSEGAHTLTYEVYDGILPVQSKVTIQVDTSAPVLGAIQYTASGTSITISGSASDAVAGMDALPYRFSVGNANSGWVANTSYTQNGLTPNTLYSVSFEARDKQGHIAKQQKNMYTQAVIPGISFSNITDTGFEVVMSDTNAAGTEYQVHAGSGYVKQDGTLSASPQWITLTNRKITVLGLSQNTTFQVQAQARNKEGVETGYSNMMSVVTLADPPRNIVFTPLQTTMTIGWENISGATGYDVEADGVIKNVGLSNGFTHTGLAADTVHTYRVRVRNAGGTGKWSSLQSVRTLPYPPPIPARVSGTATKTDIRLVWDASERAAWYEVEVDGTTVQKVTTLSYTHEGLAPDSPHVYRVRAGNAGGNSEWSPAFHIKTLPAIPPVPGSMTAQPAKTSITVTWSTVQDTQRYEIEADGMIFDAGSQNFFVHTELTPSTGHTYRVRACNEAGKSAWSVPLDVTTYPEEPAVPTNIITTSEEHAITITWYKVPYADSYDVLIDENQMVNVTELSCIHSSLQPDTQHTYKVRAKNISGVSDWSTAVTVRTQPAATDPEVQLSNVVAVITNKSVLISWEAAAMDAEYDVEVDGVLKNIGANTAFSHTGLEANTYHNYRVRVRKSEGTGGWCAVLTLCTLPDPPDAPQEVQAFPGDYSIQVEWERVEGALGYDIEVDGKVYDTQEAVVYVHDSLTPGTMHTYRVRAKNVTGITAWSPAVTLSTNNPDYIVNCIKGKNFEFSLLAAHVQDFSEVKFVVTYNPEQLTIADLCGLTPGLDVLEEGMIPGTNIHVKRTPGRIEFTVHQELQPGSSWSGEMINIIFKPNITGQTTLQLIME